MKRRINETHLRNGVTIVDPEHTYIGPDVEIAQDVIIYPGTMIKGTTTIASDAIIGPHTEIENCSIGEDTVVRQSVVTDSEIGKNVNVGPFAHIRPETSVGDRCKSWKLCRTEEISVR